MTIEWDVRTNPGDRSINEDAYGFVKGELAHCFVVADGLGAHDKGEEASAFICNYIMAHFDDIVEADEVCVRDLILEANAALMRYQELQNLRAGLRTTVVVLVVSKEQMILAHVGDSRIYCFTEQGILFQTKDHSVCQKMVQLGIIDPQEIRNHPDRNKLLSALGDDLTHNRISCETIAFQPSKFLLCTDGIWENVSEQKMLETIEKVTTPGAWLETLMQEARTQVEENMDNHTAMAVFIN